jgi:hypothetical protein
LGSFTALFVGVSFDDRLLLQRLEALASLDRTPTHFTLIKHTTSDPTLLRRLERSAGVRPILYSHHEQIPTILGHVYQAGMTSQDLTVPLESRTGKRIGHQRLSGSDYWTLLLFNKP